MLYRPEAFEELTEEPWDPNGARAAIREILADAEEQYDPDGLWPVVDEWDSPTTLYSGPAGAVLGVSGAPGTMLATRPMLEWTGEERWA